MSLANFEESVNQWMYRHLQSASRRRLWRKLSKLLDNNVNILKALESMHERRVRNHKASDTQAVAMGTWIEGMKNGRRLNEMVRGWVSPEEQMLIAAGEQSGKLQQALLSAIRVMEAKTAIISAIAKGLTYPLILTITSFVVLYVFSIKVVPQFTRVVPPETYVGAARLLINLTDFARDWILWIAGFAVTAIIAFFVSLPRWDGQVRIWLDRYAPYSIYRMMVGSSWLIGMAALLEAQVRIETAMNQLSTKASPWLEVRLDAAMQGMRSGYNLGDALNNSGYEFPDREILDDLSVYAAVSGFDEALSQIGREWLVESVESIRGMMAVIFTASIVLVASLVGTIGGGLADLEIQMMKTLQQRTR